MKTFILSLFVFILCSRTANAQNSFLGFAAPWYAQGDQQTGLKVTHRPAYIVYNAHYCYIYRDGLPVIEFPVDHIEKDPTGAETFLSEEADATPFGYYDVRIQRSTASGNTVTIQVPKVGYVITLQYCHVYSPNGEVTGHIDIAQSKPRTKPSSPLAISTPVAPPAAKSINLDSIRTAQNAALMERRRISDSTAEAHVKNMRR